MIIDTVKLKKEIKKAFTARTKSIHSKQYIKCLKEIECISNEIGHVADTEYVLISKIVKDYSILQKDLWEILRTFEDTYPHRNTKKHFRIYVRMDRHMGMCKQYIKNYVNGDTYGLPNTL